VNRANGTTQPPLWACVATLARVIAQVRTVDVGPAAGAAYLLADFGSTYTKLAAVEAGTGRLLATASHPTTLATDVLDGYDAARRALAEALPGTAFGPELACSSAGGGLRLAVVGQERLISAEAGHRVALSAGARVVAVTAGPLADTRDLRAARPDVILLVGGTDGGDESVLRHNAARLAASRLRVPVVVAGNVAAREDVVAALGGRGPVLPTANVLPDIGILDPGPARAVIRQVFLDHVIGGRKLSRGRRFRDLVRAVTPDAVLDGVSALARAVATADPDAGDVLVVDVGGATTDVYSALTHPGEAGLPERHAVADLPDRRTVEGDLGVRWSAPGVVAAAEAGKLPADGLADAAERRAADPGYLPTGAADAAVDLRLGALAATVAVRRHARQVTGYGARGVTHVVISGGAFRHAEAAARDAALAGLLADDGTRGLIGGASVALDAHYVLAPAGLLAAVDPPTATALLRRYLIRGSAS
jgi:uncharacterized protein (TIGR01319 family)